MSHVLGVLDLGDSADKACNIAVIPQNEEDAVLSVCESDGSDMGCKVGDRLLNAYAELIQIDH